MRLLITILLIKFCACSIQAQNLIPNPSFEDTIHRSFDLKFASGWSSPTKGSPDYLTSYHNVNRADWGMPQNFNGYQYGRTGNSYMGIVIYSLYNKFIKRRREYIQAKLAKALSEDSTYCLQLHVSLSDSSRYSSRGQLSIYFSQNKISENTDYHLAYTPQIIVSSVDYIVDKEEWLRFDFEYTASGGEEYIIIGNFNDTTGIDTFFVGGGRKEELAYIETYYYIDDLYLGHCDSLPDTTIGLHENVLKSKLKLYPNPIGEQFYLTYRGQEQLQFQLYNLMGQKVEAAVQQEGNRYRFSSGHLPKGVYLLEVLGREERAAFRVVRK